MTKRLLHGSLYILCFLTLSFLSCKKNIDSSPAIPGDPFPVPAATPINGTVSGRIMDENFAPVASATVDCAGLTTTTDADGFFNIKNATLDKYISTVTVTKTGYFKGYRSFSANASRNIVNIKLIPRVLTGTIDGVAGGNITLPNSTAIHFQQNSIVIKSTGATYTGTVNVFASYIDPTATDISLTVPGSFMGRDANNLYVLQSTGMLAVEMESIAGELLQLKANMPATVKLPIPASLVSKAPNTIDTWSLNETGVWVKEGTATKTGDHYEFLAAHFSFWNCDQSANGIYLNLHVQDNNGINLTNTIVQLSATDNYGFIISTYGTTDLFGNVSGIVPSATTLTLNILEIPNQCLTSLYTEAIGPFTTNASLTITATLSSQQGNTNVLGITGIANDCNGQPLQSGYAMIFSGPYFTYASVVNGNYSTALAHCSPVSSITIRIMDDNSTAQSNPSTFAVTGDAFVVPTIALNCGIPLNIYDGIYEVTGTLIDVTNSAFAGLYPKRYSLITNGTFSVIVTDSINGELVPGYIFNTGSGNSFYGSFGIQVAFDPTTNLMADMHNYYGDPVNPLTAIGDPFAGSGAPNYQASNGRRALLDPTGFNDYNPATRVIRAKYFMYQPSVVATGPRCYFDETWTYIGPR